MNMSYTTALGLLCILATSTASAQYTRTKIANPYFWGSAKGLGSSVSLSGNTMVIGAPTADTVGGTGAGLVEVHRDNGSGEWIRTAQLTSPYPAENGSFGRVVAASGDMIIVGAPGTGGGFTSPSFVHCFRQSGFQWVCTQTLINPASTNGPTFGSALSLADDVLIVGSDGEKVGAFVRGAVYVYRLQDGFWAQEFTLTGPDTGSQTDYGTSVAIEGDVAMVGSPLEGTGGVVHILERIDGLWTTTGQLIPEAGAVSARFGSSIVLHGGVALVGAPRDDAGAVDSGSAYLFRRGVGGWDQESKFLPSSPSASALFGSNVGLSDSLLLVGATTGGASGSGATYVYESDGTQWTPSAELSEFVTPTSGTHFGAALALDGGRALVGAPLNFGVGTAYLLSKPDGDWVEDWRVSSLGTAGGNRFGRAVAVSGNTIMASAPRYRATDGESGIIHVLGRSSAGWRIVESVPRPADDPTSGEFGAALAMDGDFAIVGQPTHVGPGALVLRRTGGSWSPFQTFEPPVTVESAYSGDSVAVSGDRLLVGQYGNLLGPVAPGFSSTYTFDGDAFSLEETIGVSDSAGGFVVALSGDTALVGNLRANIAHVFRFIDGTGWELEGDLLPPATATGSQFGREVAIDGDVAVVGSEGEAFYYLRTGGLWSEGVALATDDGKLLRGRVAIAGDRILAVEAQPEDEADSIGVYVFARDGDTFPQIARLVSGHGDSTDQFGSSIALTQDIIVVGAMQDSQTAFEGGALYIFEREPSGVSANWELME